MIEFGPVTEETNEFSMMLSRVHQVPDIISPFMRTGVHLLSQAGVKAVAIEDLFINSTPDNYTASAKSFGVDDVTMVGASLLWTAQRLASIPSSLARHDSETDFIIGDDTGKTLWIPARKGGPEINVTTTKEEEQQKNGHITTTSHGYTASLPVPKVRNSATHEHNFGHTVAATIGSSVQPLTVVRSTRTSPAGVVNKIGQLLESFREPGQT